MQEVAIFPIPNFVAYPGEKQTLHVFEPRYRQMIHACLENELDLCVGPTRGSLRQDSPRQNAKAFGDQVLNLSAPYPVLSGGKVKVLSHQSDGQMMVEVDFAYRFLLAEVIQEVPFILAVGKAFPEERLKEKPAKKEYAKLKQCLERIMQVNLVVEPQPNLPYSECLLYLTNWAIHRLVKDTDQKLDLLQIGEYGKRSAELRHLFSSNPEGFEGSPDGGQRGLIQKKDNIYFVAF